MSVTVNSLIHSSVRFATYLIQCIASIGSCYGMLSIIEFIYFTDDGSLGDPNCYSPDAEEILTPFERLEKCVNNDKVFHR